MRKEMDQNTMDLLSLVFANRAEEAIPILDGGDFDKDILKDIFIFSEFGGNESNEYTPLPLYMITKANEIYFASDDFIESAMPVVRRNREGIKTLMDYWDGMGYPVDSPIQFEDYQDLCAHFSYLDYCNEEDWKYLLDGTLTELIAKGYDENEARMCMALLTYYKPEIDHQIRLGTNPNVWISCDVETSECNEMDGNTGLSTSYDSVNDAQICYDCWDYWESVHGDKIKPVRYDQIRGLFGAAAYEELIPTLERLSDMKTES